MNSSLNTHNTDKGDASSSPPQRNRFLMPGILLAIISGVILGGWFPQLAVKTSLLGEIFLNTLMMLVVPLVMLSMLVGITRLDNLRNLGSLGGKTLFYYLFTTGVAVIIGIALVNIIRPGKGLQPGEEHPEFQYELQGSSLRTLKLTDALWHRKAYSKNYQVLLMDQQIIGSIDSFSSNQVTVSVWEKLTDNEKIYLVAEDGKRISFQRVGNKLVSSEPSPTARGKGVAIVLSSSNYLGSKKNASILNTFRELLVGNPEKEQQGLIPRNIFTAMVKMDILPLILFSLLLGAALSVMGTKAEVTIQLFSTLNDAVMQLVHWVMLISPVGIFGLIASRIGNAGGFTEFLPELLSLGKYTLTVIIGLLLHGAIILSLVLRFLGKRAPIHYLKGMGTALLNAFSTASSTATLPLTLQGVEEENKISNRTAGFVLPLGATINMDGTALYEAVAAIFIAQAYGIELEPVQQGIIFITATLAAIGAAGIPEAGLVTMLIVLKAVNLPLEGIGLLLTIDWLLDRFRTTINVWGDSVGAAVIERLENISQNKAILQQ